MDSVATLCKSLVDNYEEVITALNFFYKLLLFISGKSEPFCGVVPVTIFA